MSRPALVGGDIELPGDLPVGSRHTVMVIVEVDEEESASPFVGSEHLHGGRHTGAP